MGMKNRHMEEGVGETVVGTAAENPQEKVGRGGRQDTEEEAETIAQTERLRVRPLLPEWRKNVRHHPEERIIENYAREVEVRRLQEIGILGGRISEIETAERSLIGEIWTSGADSGAVLGLCLDPTVGMNGNEETGVVV